MTCDVLELLLHNLLVHGAQKSFEPHVIPKILQGEAVLVVLPQTPRQKIPAFFTEMKYSC